MARNNTPETVKIVRKACPGGFCVVNRADMKPGDKIYVERKPRRRNRSVLNDA